MIDHIGPKPRFSLNRSENDTSVALDLLRALAAEMVCVGHAISFFLPQWRAVQPAYMQNVGVLLFFLISGFLITYTLVTRSHNPGYDFRQFFIERFARIYSGLVPALVIIAAIDAITIYLTSDPIISRNFTFKTLVANLFMLESYRGIFSDLLRWPAFGSASPLWTLGIEWHIYLLVAALFFMAVRPKPLAILIAIALFFGQTPIHFLFGSYQPDGVGRGLFMLWLCGALVYLAMRFRVMGFIPAVALGVGGTSGFVLLAHAGGEYDFKLYPFLIAAFLGLIAGTQSTHVLKSPKLTKPISFFADYSFSLYLVHHTIMYAMWTISPSRGLQVFAVAIVISNLVAMGLAEVGEKHHRKLARTLNRRFFPGASQSLAT